MNHTPGGKLAIENQSMTEGLIAWDELDFGGAVFVTCLSRLRLN